MLLIRAIINSQKQEGLRIRNLSWWKKAVWSRQEVERNLRRKDVVSPYAGRGSFTGEFFCLYSCRAERNLCKHL